jgi:predicted translin family RNA/ssDNA-binding protein
LPNYLGKPCQAILKIKLQQNVDGLLSTRNKENDEIIKLEKNVDRGKEEILKAISGDSVFIPEEIRESIDSAKGKLSTLAAEIESLTAI